VRVYDIILKKRNGGELSAEEIGFLIKGYTAGTIPDYQLAAFAMAVYFQGMTERETLDLTLAMAQSGETVSLGKIPGLKVDKHSTGGVGDTTTLVLAPLVAAAGVPVAKMTGRSLGHTGGTLDKLEAIPGFKTGLSIAEMIKAVQHNGIAVAGQTANLVPADKKLYALRDVTATVDSLPLIAASIMSKKLAAGADAIVLDVKTGDGAFMKDLEDSFALAEAMVKIGTGAGRETVAVITNMDQPLGCAVGNSLEVQEAILTLQGKGPADLEELCLYLGGWMLRLAGKAAGLQEGRDKLKELIESGAALEKFRELILAQHGDAAVIDDPALLPRAASTLPVPAETGGYVHRLGAEAIGRAALALGAGRENKEDPVDFAVGVILFKKRGDRVFPGDELARLHLNCAPDAPPAETARRLVTNAYEIKPGPADKPQLILGYVDRTGRHYIS
jgi:pyrimidine-nucleoside phosphorylase